MTRCGHAKAGFIADPLENPVLNEASALPINVEVINLNRIGAFI
jgi:hypothetical protein